MDSTISISTSDSLPLDNSLDQELAMGMLKLRRLQKQIPLITLPRVNSQDERRNNRYRHLPELEKGGDDKNFLIKGWECSISF